MKDLIGKLAKLEATAPKAPAKKKLLTEDSVSPAEVKKPSLKDVFNQLSETVAPGQKPLPVMDPQNKKAGMGFVTSNNPAVQNMLKNLDPKDVQIVQAPGQQQQGQVTGTTGATQGGQGNAMSVAPGQQAVREKDEGKPGKNFAKIAKSAAKRYGSKEAGERVAGAVRAKLAKQGKLEEEDMDEGLKDNLKKAALGAVVAGNLATIGAAGKSEYDYHNKRDQQTQMTQADTDKAMGKKHHFEGAKVDRMVKHIEKSERKLGKSKEKASDIAWATANKRGMLDNKNKKKVDEILNVKLSKRDPSEETKWNRNGWPLIKQPSAKAHLGAAQYHDEQANKWKAQFRDALKNPDMPEKGKEAYKWEIQRNNQEAKRHRLAAKNFDAVKEADIPSSQGIDNNSPFSGSARSMTTLEGKEPQVEVIDNAFNRENYKDLIGKKYPKSKAPAYARVKEISEGQLNELDPKTLKNYRAIAKGQLRDMASLEPSFGKNQDQPKDRENRKAKRLKGLNLADKKLQDTLEEAKPDFLDLDKDGNKKESMKKAAADKKKKKVDESMNHRISAARLEGKSHGLKGHAHCGKNFEDLEERKAYCEGYKDGLDECYGMGVYETAPGMPPATVGGMAKQELDELSPKTLGSYHDAVQKSGMSINHRYPEDYNSLSPDEQRKIKNRHIGSDRAQGRLFYGQQPGLTKEDEFDEGNAFTGALAKTPKGGKFSVGGKSFTDHSSLEEDPMFESWDNQLKALVNEGLSVSVSKGNDHADDSVNINATGAESEELLQLVKHAGLGLFGDEAAHEPSSAMSLQPSHGGEADEVGAGGVDIDVVDDSDSMLSLMKKLGGVEQSGSEDYADEEGDEGCGCEEETNEATCNECGMMESDCGCDTEEVDEMQTPDQLEATVAEENAPDDGSHNSSNDEKGNAAANNALAVADAGQDKEEGEEDAAEAEEEDDLEESFSFESIYRKLDMIAESAEEDEEDDEESEQLDELSAELLNKASDAAWERGRKVDPSMKPDDMAHRTFGQDERNAAGKFWQSKADKFATAANAADKRDTARYHHEKERTGMSPAQRKQFDKMKASGELNEWANQVGKGEGKGTDASFEQDIEFMTKVIAGGLNKPKSTGQTTIPVIAGQEDRMHDNPQDWATLAGIKK